MIERKSAFSAQGYGSYGDPEGLLHASAFSAERTGDVIYLTPIVTFKNALAREN